MGNIMSLKQFVKARSVKFRPVFSYSLSTSLYGNEIKRPFQSMQKIVLGITVRENHFKKCLNSVILSGFLRVCPNTMEKYILVYHSS